jgi:hypothetical protein
MRWNSEIVTVDKLKHNCDYRRKGKRQKGLAPCPKWAVLTSPYTFVSYMAYYFSNLYRWMEFYPGRASVPASWIDLRGGPGLYLFPR